MFKIQVHIQDDIWFDVPSLRGFEEAKDAKEYIWKRLASSIDKYRVRLIND